MNSSTLSKSIITQTQAEQLISLDYGVCVIKDLNGSYIDLTTESLSLILKKYKSRKQAVGLTEYELIGNEKIVQLYHTHDRLAMSGKTWAGLEPCWWNEVPVYASVTKYGIEDEKGKIIGSFLQGMILKNQMILKNLQELKAHQLRLDPQQHPYFEIETRLKHSKYDLTPREAECLFYTIRGKTAKSISVILGISPKTVEFHLISLKSKFNCYSKAELISTAIEQGFLQKMPSSILGLSTLQAANSD